MINLAKRQTRPLQWMRNTTEQRVRRLCKNGTQLVSVRGDVRDAQHCKLKGRATFLMQCSRQSSFSVDRASSNFLVVCCRLHSAWSDSGTK